MPFVFSETPNSKYILLVSIEKYTKAPFVGYCNPITQNVTGHVKSVKNKIRLQAFQLFESRATCQMFRSTFLKSINNLWFIVGNPWTHATSNHINVFWYQMKNSKKITSDLHNIS